MPKELKELKVTEVSILTGDMNPANGKSVIVKSDNSFEIIAKADKCIDGYVHCTVMTPAELDSDEEFATAETIAKAQESRMVELQKGAKTIDENHTHKPLEGVHLARSWIDENGVWKDVYNVNGNPVMLEKAKKGEITGVSIYGKAQKVEKAGKEFNADNAGMLKQIMDWLKSKFDKEEKEEINKSEGNEMPITKDEFNAMAKECGYEPVAKTPETPAANAEVETLKATVKTLAETVEKQAKTIEEIAKARTTDNKAGNGIVTMETIAKCADPLQRKEMLATFIQNKNKERKS
jgi:hypothetical protein